MNSDTSLLIAIITAFVAPAVLALIQQFFRGQERRQEQFFRSQEKKQDWDRQDALAAQAAASAELLLERQTISAAKADEAARLLKHTNTIVAEKVDETARLLEINTAATAAKVDEAARLLRQNAEIVAKTVEITAAETQGQLRQIHTLVNGGLTAAMQREFDQRVLSLKLIHELNASSATPTPENLALAEQMSAEVEELRKQIANRIEHEASADVVARNLENKIEKLKRGT